MTGRRLAAVLLFLYSIVGVSLIDWDQTPVLRVLLRLLAVTVALWWAIHFATTKGRQ